MFLWPLYSSCDPYTVPGTLTKFLWPLYSSCDPYKGLMTLVQYISSSLSLSLSIALSPSSSSVYLFSWFQERKKITLKQTPWLNFLWLGVKEIIISNFIPVSRDVVVVFPSFIFVQSKSSLPDLSVSASLSHIICKSANLYILSSLSCN